MMKINKNWLTIQYEDIVNMVIHMNNALLNTLVILLLILSFFSPLLSSIWILILFWLYYYNYLDLKTSNKSILIYLKLFFIISLLWIIFSQYNENQKLVKDNNQLKRTNIIVLERNKIMNYHHLY